MFQRCVETTLESQVFHLVVKRTNENDLGPKRSSAQLVATSILAHRWKPETNISIRNMSRRDLDNSWNTGDL